MDRDSRAVLTRWAPPPDFTVSYGELADHVCDVRLPAHHPGTATLVIFIHGGFWRHSYDRTHTGPLAVALAAHGFVVATPEYRRTGAPGGRGDWPATFEDLAAAVRALPDLVMTRAAEAGVRASGPLILAGHSAGGHLALWAAAGMAPASKTSAEPGTSTPYPRVVALAPVADLREAYRLDLDGGAVATLLGGGPAQVPARYAAADPMARLPLGCRVEVVHGARDRQVPCALSRRFVAAAVAAGDPARLVELPDADHFDLIDPESPAWPVVVGAFDAAADSG